MHFLASAIFMQAALNFQRQFLCLRHSRNVDFEDNTRKAHVCTHSPLATLPVSLLFECRVSQPWSFSFTISWECFISNVTSTLAFSGTSLTLLFACFLIHSKSCPDLYTRSQDPLSSAFHPSRDTWLPWDLHTPIRIQQREGGREVAAYRLRTSSLGLGNEPSGKSWKMTWPFLFLTTSVSLLFWSSLFNVTLPFQTQHQ